jgi:hypothetical protein
MRVAQAVSPVFIVALLGAALNLAGCQRNQTPPIQQPTEPSTPATRKAVRPAFDEKRAFELLVKQCDFGPRPVGSEAHRKTRDWLVAEMSRYADKTIAQDFQYRGMPLTNVIGIFRPEQKRQILLCAHWDTRPTADQEIDPARQKKPILGANDGASGVAVLLELARIFHQQKPDAGVAIVLLDGEDYGNFETNEGVFLGSRYFARNQGDLRPTFGILLDMVGDKNLDIYRERLSDTFAGDINRKVFGVAADLGYAKYLVDALKFDIQDDHIPLNRAGIPTIDLIDFDYAPWHTLDDTVDKCSPESLKIVGETVAEVVYRERARKP